MLRKCCCFDLRTGSVLIAAVRLISWLLIFTAGAYLTLHLFVLNHRGMVSYTVMVNLEQNGKHKSCVYQSRVYAFEIICIQIEIVYLTIKDIIFCFSICSGIGDYSISNWNNSRATINHGCFETKK